MDHPLYIGKGKKEKKKKEKRNEERKNEKELGIIKKKCVTKKEVRVGNAKIKSHCTYG